MPYVARKDDEAGGALIPTYQSFVFQGDREFIVLTDDVASHGIPPHDDAVMVEASSFVFIEELPVCRVGDDADCGHSVNQVGTNHVLIEV